MLIEFSVRNFLSFKEKATFSLLAAPIKQYDEDNTFTASRYTLLKGAVIYGANASGKSNFIEAMAAMKRLVLQSFQQSSTEEFDITPFLLNTETEASPSFFEVVCLINDIKYRYGFELGSRKVHAEWLFETTKTAERPLFIREEAGIAVMKNFTEGKDLEERTRDNALFLTIADQFNGKISKQIMKWFKDFVTISALKHTRYKGITFRMLENDTQNQKLLDFYKSVDLGFNSLSINKTLFDPKDLPGDLPEDVVKQLLTDLEGAFKIDIKSIHKKYNADNEPVADVEFDMRSQESAGTNKLLNMSGPIFDTLNTGGVLVVDELDASLHPLLTLTVVSLFNSSVYNRNNAQLVFTTHDTNLLHYGKYRRDQIYFVEKDRYGASSTYSLVEYKEGNKKVRQDASYEKDYIQGRYGAIPYIGNLSEALSNGK